MRFSSAGVLKRAAGGRTSVSPGRVVALHVLGNPLAVRVLARTSGRQENLRISGTAVAKPASDSSELEATWSVAEPEEHQVAVNAVRHFERVNKELWLILSMFVIALMLNSLVDSQRMMLSFYMMPTLGSAYLYGRRHATLTAFASVLLVVLLTMTLRALRPASTRGVAAPVGVARSDGVGRHAHRDRVPDGHALRAQEPSAAGAARNLQRRAAPSPALHLEGRIHRAPLVSRLGVRDEDRRAPRPRLPSASKTCVRLACCTISAS